MHEIHAPHETPGSWRAFFTHIATIVTGLLIAVALEQGVEYLHHRHQARQMAELLREESTRNRDVATFDIERAEEIIRAIEIDLNAINGAGAGKAAPTLALIPAGHFYLPSDAAWITMRDSALLPIVPQILVGNYWKIETTLKALEDRFRDGTRSQYRVSSLLNLRPDPSLLTPAELDALRLALSDYREHLRGYLSVLRGFLAANDLALAGKVIDFAVPRAAPRSSAQ